MLAPPFLGPRVKGDDRIQGASCAHLGSPSSSLDLKNSSIGDNSSHVGIPRDIIFSLAKEKNRDDACSTVSGAASERRRSYSRC